MEVTRLFKLLDARVIDSAGNLNRERWDELTNAVKENDSITVGRILEIDTQEAEEFITIWNTSKEELHLRLNAIKRNNI